MDSILLMAILALAFVTTVAVCVIMFRQHKGPALAQDVGGKAQVMLGELKAFIAKHDTTPPAPPAPPATPTGASG